MASWACSPAVPPTGPPTRCTPPLLQAPPDHGLAAGEGSLSRQYEARLLQLFEAELKGAFTGGLDQGHQPNTKSVQELVRRGPACWELHQGWPRVQGGAALWCPQVRGLQHCGCRGCVGCNTPAGRQAPRQRAAVWSGWKPSGSGDGSKGRCRSLQRLTTCSDLCASLPSALRPPQNRSLKRTCEGHPHALYLVLRQHGCLLAWAYGRRLGSGQVINALRPA